MQFVLSSRFLDIKKVYINLLYKRIFLGLEITRESEHVPSAPIFFPCISLCFCREFRLASKGIVPLFHFLQPVLDGIEEVKDSNPVQA